MSTIKPIKAPESVRAAPLPSDPDPGAPGNLVAVDPTQVRRPWRSTARTVFQAFVGLCVLAPLLVTATGLKVEQLPWLGVVLAVALAVTRVMALPGVETWLRTFVPFLAAAPPADGEHRANDAGATTLQTAGATLMIIMMAVVLLAVVRLL